MSGIRNKIEHLFENAALLIYRNRIAFLLAGIGLVALFATQLPKLTLDLSTEGFFHKDDPALKTYEAFREQFGRDEMVIVALKPKAVFEKRFLEQLRALHEDLEANTPHLEDITSLINARNTRGEKDALIVEDLFEKWPQNDADLEKIKQRALNNVMYKNMLISEDGRFTTIVIQTRNYSIKEDAGDELDDFADDAAIDDDFSASATAEPVKSASASKTYLTDAENSELIRAVENIVKKHSFEGTEIYIAGSPVVTDFLKRTMMKDVKKFVKIIIITIAVFLFVMFRRITGVLMPLFVVAMSLVSTVGLMAAAGTPIKLPTQILPTFILAVGVGDSVHILVIFFYHFNRNGNKRDAIAYALGHSGLAVLMTSLTTAGGLLSFSTAALAPIADLGKFAAVGVLLALVYTVLFLPALIAVAPLKPKRLEKSGKAAAKSFFDRLLNGVANVSIRHPLKTLMISGFIVITGAVGLSRIWVSHNPMKWLPVDNPARVANEMIDAEMRGTTSLEVIVDTGKENGLYDPDLLNRLEESAAAFENYESDKVYAGKAWTITTILKETNQALHANNADFYNVPQDKNLIAQEFFLFENSGSEDLEDVTDSSFSKARFTIKVPFIDAIAYTSFFKTVEQHFENTFPDATVELTGMVKLFMGVVANAIYSMATSYGYAIIIITILMVVLIGKVRIGLLSMIPNLSPIIVMIGIMGWAGIPLDLFSMLVGSIAIGLAVDDTIHFMHNFRRYFEEHADAAEAVRLTLLTTGRAMLVTTIVLSIGFFTFMFASMTNLFNFGLLTGLTILLALLSDYFIAPALMIVVNRR